MWLVQQLLIGIAVTAMLDGAWRWRRKTIDRRGGAERGGLAFGAVVAGPLLMMQPSQPPPGPDGLASPFRSVPVVYTAPTRLPYGESAEFQLVVASADLAKARAAAARALGGGEAVVAISPVVRAELTGPPSDVEIALQGEVAERRTDLQNVTWRWWVTPKRDGETRLRMTLLSRVSVNGVDGYVDRPVFERSFRMTKTLGQRLQTWLEATDEPREFLWAVIPAVWFGGRWLRERMRKRRPPPTWQNP